MNSEGKWDKHEIYVFISIFIGCLLIAAVTLILGYVQKQLDTPKVNSTSWFISHFNITKILNSTI